LKIKPAKNIIAAYLHYPIMKYFIGFLFALITITGCKQSTGNDAINTAITHFASVFIAENIHSVNALRVKGKPAIKTETDSTFLISGMVEGFSPMNYPVSIDRFTERLWYSGSNPEKRESWKCIEIYIGNKKVK
jgi:hypothetical protein